MRVLLDTNVILDLFLDREPFANNAAAIWTANERKYITGYVSAITPVNVFYIASKLKGIEIARQAVAEILSALRICPVDHITLQESLKLPFQDFEDAVQHACAAGSQIQMIITRNTKDFSAATMSVLSPAEFIAQYPEICIDQGMVTLD